jgi:hypothetical protein
MDAMLKQVQLPTLLHRGGRPPSALRLPNVPKLPLPDPVPPLPEPPPPGE